MPIENLSAEQVREKEERLAQLSGPRRCGSCTACCQVLGVVELNKQSFNPCIHQANGCAIYANRPVSCRIWSCDWLLGGDPGGDERHRPDALGLMFTRELIGQAAITVVWEVRPGAAQGSQGKYLLKKIADKQPVVLIRNGGARGEVFEVVAASRIPEAARAQILERFQKHRASVKADLRANHPDYGRS